MKEIRQVMEQPFQYTLLMHFLKTNFMKKSKFVLVNCWKSAQCAGCRAFHNAYSKIMVQQILITPLTLSFKTVM